MNFWVEFYVIGAFMYELPTEVDLLLPGSDDFYRAG
jgi:hypothetical protein